MVQKNKGPSAWDRLRSRAPADTTDYRDVYSNQQFERGHGIPFSEKKPYIIASIIASVVVAVIIYLIAGSMIGVGGWISNAAHQNVYQAGRDRPYFYEDSRERSLWMSSERIHIRADKDGYFDENEEPISDEEIQARYEAYFDGWVKDHPEEWAAYQADVEANENKSGFQFAGLHPMSFLLALLAGLIVYAVASIITSRQLEAQNALSRNDDINQYPNDQHIALPEEIQSKFDFFPDIGAHSSVCVSSMLSHTMLSNKGVDPVQMALRASHDEVDDEGDVVLYKGDLLTDEQGEIVRERKPLLDKDMQHFIFDNSNVPKEFQIVYDPGDIPYNPDGKNRDKQKFKSVAELINKDWDMPDYEPQRPAGAYLVDSDPVHTMVIAITRAGKGQTYIEPTLDMWTREKTLSNFVANDPKGELLRKFYVRAAVRGYQVVQYNLINPMKTDIYNPLFLASEAAREGNMSKMAAYIVNIANVFFPQVKGEEPVWSNAANNAFRRAAYGLIDYYIEEETELRDKALRDNIPDKVLEKQLDRLWGHVTLFNCYQFFVQLTSKKVKNPKVALSDKWKADVKAWKELAGNRPMREVFADDPRYQEYVREFEKANEEAFLWEDKAELDLLALFFNASKYLPRNEMRTQVQAVDDALRSISGAEKMLASVYGIAITAMSFFSDPTIYRMTSGMPSQNVDLGGMSFPRRFGVRFKTAFIEKYHLKGAQVKWDCFEDADFKKPLGADFEHTDIISLTNWAMGYFKGMFQNEVSYLRLRLFNADTGMLLRSFYFEFRKMYKMSLNGEQYVTDPVLGTKVVLDGILTELKPFKRPNGEIVYRPGRTTFKNRQLTGGADDAEVRETNDLAIMRTLVKYNEKPKAIFLVTPPHLMSYAKLLLIFIKQSVDLNFDQSYLTKPSQKP